MSDRGTGAQKGISLAAIPLGPIGKGRGDKDDIRWGQEQRENFDTNATIHILDDGQAIKEKAPTSWLVETPRSLLSLPQQERNHFLAWTGPNHAEQLGRHKRWGTIYNNVSPLPHRR